jgi:hypothetical protein
LTPDLSPASIVEIIIIAHGEHVQAQADACRILLEGSHLAHYIPALAERMAQQQAQHVAALSQLLRAGCEAGEFRHDLEVEVQARILMALLHGLMVQWHRQPGSVDWHAIAQEFLRGLRPH